MQDKTICSRCILDTTVPDITFDRYGVCNYCSEYFTSVNKALLDEKIRDRELNKLLARIRTDGMKKDHDCIVGVSGGLDSSYALYKARKMGLRPLAVHLDNGWNTEISNHNVDALVRGLGVELYKHVVDWEEFRSLQLAFFKSNVIDIEMLTDNLIISTLYKAAFDKNIKYIVAGTNFVNEGLRMPSGWAYNKLDTRNIMAIYKRFGGGKKLKDIPLISLCKYLKYRFIDGIRWISILNYLPYEKEAALRILANEVGYRPYGKKHYESVFTRFYQGYILPNKFEVDKRKIHYSNLICSGQMTREEALSLMKGGAYDSPAVLEEDKKYVLGKLGFTDKEFAEYIGAAPSPHSCYPSCGWILTRLRIFKKLLKKYNKV